AKVGEAERFVSAGFDDVRIAYVVIGNDKYARIADLMDQASISFCIDTFEGARAASSFFTQHGRPARVLLEVDSGHHRCGVDPEDPSAIELATEIARLPGLELVGILTHAGQSYHGPAEDESLEAALQRASDHERDVMLGFAAALAASGIADPQSF